MVLCRTLLLMLIVGASSLCLSQQVASITQTPIYKDQSRSFEVRAADLVARMTLEEKVSQMLNEAPAIPRLDVP
ncbi:hypothetical protein [Cellvibrio sp.]